MTAASGIEPVALDDILAAGTSIETVRTDFEGDVSPSNEVTLNANVAVNEVKVGDGAVQLNDITGGIALVSSDAGMALSTEKLMLGTLELQPAGYVIDGGPIDFSIDGDDLKTEIILSGKGKILSMCLRMAVWIQGFGALIDFFSCQQMQTLGPQKMSLILN